MKINLIEMEGLLRGQCIPGDLLVNETLAEYLVRQFDKLEQQLAAVVAERDVVNADNAYLRGEVIRWARECDRITYTYTNKITDTHQLKAERDLSNTNPAIGAYLAEVLAVEAKSIYESILDNSAVTDMESLVDWLEQHAKDSISFAAQLRQGGEHE